MDAETQLYVMVPQDSLEHYKCCLEGLSNVAANC